MGPVLYWIKNYLLNLAFYICNSVMADKGFSIKNELAEIFFSLVQPIFMSDKIRFSVEEKNDSCRISKL